MRRLISMVAIVLCAALISGCDEEPKLPPSKSGLKKLAVRMLEASRKGNMTTVVDMTYPTVIDGLGGRSKAIKTFTESYKRLKEDRMKILLCEVESVGNFYTDRRWTFSLIRTRTEIEVPDGTMIERKHMLAISEDEGKTWKFLDTAGLEDETARIFAIPKLPEGLKLPDEIPVEFVPNEDKDASGQETADENKSNRT